MMTAVNHRDTVTRKTHRERFLECLRILKREVHPSEPKYFSCVLCVSVALWLTSVIHQKEDMTKQRLTELVACAG